MSKSSVLKEKIDRQCSILGVATSYKENTSIKDLTAMLEKLTTDVSEMTGLIEEPAVVNPVEESAVVNPVEESAVVNPVEESAVVNPVEEPAVVNPVEESAVVNPVEEPETVNPVEEPETVNPVEEPETVKPVEPTEKLIIATATFIHMKNGKQVKVKKGETCLVPISELDGEKGALNKGLATIVL